MRNSSRACIGGNSVGAVVNFSDPEYVRWQIALLLGKLSKGVQRLLAHES